MTLPNSLSNNFFSVATNPEDFNFRGMNLSKLFHDLYISGQYKNLDSKYKKKKRLKFKNLLGITYRFLNEICHLMLQKKTRPFVFVGTTGKRNVSINGRKYDIYTEKIFSKIGREKFIFLSKSRFSKDTITQPDFVIENFSPIFTIASKFYKIFQKKNISNFATKISRSYGDLGFSRTIIERTVCHFEGAYLSYSFLLHIWKPQRVYFLCHYSNPGLIAACKKMRIPIIELQHGHIMRSHRYYCLPVFPESYRKSFQFLLPDKIGVYGEYWRNNLIEGKQFLPEQIFVSGYYLLVPEIIKKSRKLNSKTTILITTQPHVQNEIIDYVRFLRDNLDSSFWKVVIKLHPSEDGTAYKDLLIDDFIVLETDNLYSLLNEADIHITVFSTVVFEAVRYPLTNYSLYSKNVEDYCTEIIESGVALPLQPNELPKLLSTNESEKGTYYFEEFLPELLITS